LATRIKLTQARYESLARPDEFDQRQGRQYRGGAGAD
jgi:hypothetical protein